MRNFILIRKSNIIAKVNADCSISVYDLSLPEAKIYHFSGVMANTWGLINGQRAVSDIIFELQSSEEELFHQEVVKEVMLSINNMIKSNLIETKTLF